MGAGAEGRPVVLARGLPPAWRERLGAGGGSRCGRCPKTCSSRRARCTHIVALCGGVGGAKLADGLQQLLAPGALSVIVNTGDDFEHRGLPICPDLDTVLYTLAGVANAEQGWGRADETWRVQARVA